MSENFRLIKHIGTISTSTSWNMELNYGKWFTNKPQYDLRTWSPDHKKCGKGIGFSEEEAKALLDILSHELEDDSNKENGEIEHAVEYSPLIDIDEGPREKTCDNCKCSKQGCGQTKNPNNCIDYEALPYISKEERELWPKYTKSSIGNVDGKSIANRIKHETIKDNNY